MSSCFLLLYLFLLLRRLFAYSQWATCPFMHTRRKPDFDKIICKAHSWLSIQSVSLSLPFSMIKQWPATVSLVSHPKHLNRQWRSLLAWWIGYQKKTEDDLVNMANEVSIEPFRLAMTLISLAKATIEKHAKCFRSQALVAHRLDYWDVSDCVQPRFVFHERTSASSVRKMSSLMLFYCVVNLIFARKVRPNFCPWKSGNIRSWL